MALDSLTEQERAILDLEQQWWATTGGKEAAIAAMGLSPVRYYQLLSRLLVTEKAIAYASVTVNRMHRIQSRNSSQRRASAHSL